MADNRRQAVLRILLAAEREAEEIVNAAKVERVAKLQQAKQESRNEVAGLRADMELQFLDTVAESNADLGMDMQRLEEDGETKINHLKSEAEKVRDDVTSMLLQHVMAVRI